MKIFHTMNIDVIDIVFRTEFDADFIYANGFWPRAMVSTYIKHILINYCILLGKKS